MPDYTPVTEQPPTGSRTPVLDNLRLAAQTPGEWMRVAVYDTAKTASSVAHAWRSGHRKPPPGRWEFRSGAVEGEPGRYGVWARLIAE